MANPPPRYKKPRVFVRAVDSITYSLNDARRQRLTEIPRVIRRDYREFLNANLERVEEKSIISPANDPFITQSLHTHFVLLPPGARDKGHGHQNEAFIYFLHGRGFDMHDGIRYDWEAGDALARSISASVAPAMRWPCTTTRCTGIIISILNNRRWASS